MRKTLAAPIVGLMPLGLMALGLTASTAAFAEGGPYLALDAGQSTFKDVCTGIVAPLTCKDTGTLVRIAGGYNFAQMWGMFTPGFEIGYADLGEANLTGGSFKAKALQVEAAGSLAVGGGFSIIAKLGFSRASADLDAGAQGFGTPGASSSRNNGACAIGAQYDFNDRIGIRAQYENLRMFGESVAAGETNIRAISAGLVYRL